MYDVVQIAGSLLILAAFIASMLGRLPASSYAYLGANAIGSGALTATAIVSVEPGFILLEGVWALVSVVSLLRRAAGRSVGPQH